MRHSREFIAKVCSYRGNLTAQEVSYLHPQISRCAVAGIWGRHSVGRFRPTDAYVDRGYSRRSHYRDAPDKPKPEPEPEPRTAVQSRLPGKPRTARGIREWGPLPRVHTGYKPGRLIDLGLDQCRFTIRDRVMCGAKVHPGTSWCPECREKVYVMRIGR